jgi:hypothetical protein
MQRKEYLRAQPGTGSDARHSAWRLEPSFVVADQALLLARSMRDPDGLARLDVRAFGARFAPHCVGPYGKKNGSK